MKGAINATLWYYLRTPILSHAQRAHKHDNVTHAQRARINMIMRVSSKRKMKHVN